MFDWISPDIISFAVFIALVIGTALFGGQWGANDWYRALSKPAWTPPDWLFPIAWTVLYLMIAIAGWLIWETPHPDRGLLVGVWGAQLFFNAAWSYIFFGQKRIAGALGDISLLWLSIALFIVLAWDVNRDASYLFMPYLVWVSYAGALNASILMRNPMRER